MAYTNEALGKALEDLTDAYQHFLDKTKEAAIAAIGDTVIKQIKQDSKEYIASELAAQKDKLEKAIETAKIAIRNSVIEAEISLKQASEAKKKELAALITAAENVLNEKAAKTVQEINTTAQEELLRLQKVKEDAKKEIDKIKETIITEYEKKSKTYTDNLLIKIFQNGYIQWPGMPSPLEDTSLHFEGYSWHEVNYAGNFFRAKGRNAKTFSTKRLTKEQIKDGAYVFQDDEQGDAIRNIKGYIGIEGTFNFSAPFYKETPARQKVDSWQNNPEEYKKDEMGFDASLVVPTAEENRPRNLTFTIWVLVKDE